MDTPWAPVGAISIFPHVTSSPMRGTLSLDRMMVGSSASSVSSIRGEVAHLDTGHHRPVVSIISPYLVICRSVVILTRSLIFILFTKIPMKLMTSS